MSGFKHHGRGPLLFCLAERTGFSKAEDLESEVCERELSARLNQKLSEKSMVTKTVWSGGLLLEADPDRLGRKRKT